MIKTSSFSWFFYIQNSDLTLTANQPGKNTKKSP